MTAPNTMPRAPLEVTASRQRDAVVIRLHNPGRQIAFFERAEILATADGDEILPVEYTDNYGIQHGPGGRAGAAAPTARTRA